MIIYYLGVKIYALAVYLLASFNEKADFMVKGRKKIFNRISQDINSKDKHIWIHAASLGEFEQGRPVIEEIRKRYPLYKIVLTFFSPSGYEVRKNYSGADYIYYLPLDSPKNARRFVELIKPEKVFFIKYEFWFFYLRELKKNNIPVFIFSTIFRDNQIFFKWYGGLWRKMLSFFTHIFVQNEESMMLLKAQGVSNCSIAGDTRFDRVYEIASMAKSLPLIEKFANNSKVVVCGSTWPKDEDNIIKYFSENLSDYKWIIAPHETHKKHIDDIVSKINGEVLLYTELNELNVESSRILIIDCIGILSSVYQYADFSYIGGGFGRGIHNTLEAATFGLTIVFGPNYHQFKEAVEMKNLGAAFSYEQYTELKEYLDVLVNDDSFVKSRGKIASEYVKNNIGATKLIINNSFIV